MDHTSLPSSGVSHFYYISLPLNMQRDRVRPDPVSCQSCRSKKLKCSRVHPCSNCTTRGITCNFLFQPQGKVDATSTSNNNADLLGRIERLESIVLKQKESTQPVSNHASDDSHVTRQELLHHGSQRVFVSNIHRKRDQDSQLLENVGLREDSLVCESRLNALYIPFLYSFI